MLIKLYHLNQRQKDVLYELEKTRGDDIILLETRLSPTDSQFELLISFGSEPEKLSCEILGSLIALAEPGDEEKLLCPNVKINEGKLFPLAETQKNAVFAACRGE